MSCRDLGALVLSMVSFLAVAACARESPVAPDAASTGVVPTGASSQTKAGAQTSAAGTYQISFLKETLQGLQPVLDFTLNVREALVLKSRITDSNGVPAVEGTVTYEYCEQQNIKVASAECESGQGRWQRHMSMTVDQYGSLAHFGYCSTPRTIGFRVRFSGQGSNIASGISAARDISWQ